MGIPQVFGAARGSSKMKLILVALVFAAIATGESAEVEEGAAGTIGCRYWRMRSITKATGQYWQVKEINFFESADGSGNAVKGKAIASSFKGDVNTSTNKADKAMDGKADTFWSAANDLKFEWIGVEFESPKDIRSIKAQLSDWMMGPTMVIVEKSMDGQEWSRVNEVSSMGNWGKSAQVFPLMSMDKIPNSVFALRSQKNPRFCVGVKPTPNAQDKKADPYPIFEDAALEVQVCDDNKNTQYWQFGSKGQLQNAANQAFYLHTAKDPAEGGALSVKECKEGCPTFTNDFFDFAAEAKGGLMFSKKKNGLVIAPKGGALKAGTAVEFGNCGDADIKKCADKQHFQWELNPMFVLEKGKQTVACAPYSHQHVKPAPCTSRVKAQQLCAKDNACSAYNWAGSSVTDAAVKDKVYLCTDLHEVHSGVAGWELGVRAGRLEPFVEEKREL